MAKGSFSGAAPRRADGAASRFRASWTRPREGRRLRLLPHGALEEPYRGAPTLCDVCGLRGGHLRRLNYRFRPWGDPYAQDVPAGGLAHYWCATIPAEAVEREIPVSWGTPPALFLELAR